MKKWKPTKADVEWTRKMFSLGSIWAIPDTCAIVEIVASQKKLVMISGTWEENDRVKIIAEDCLGWTTE